MNIIKFEIIEENDLSYAIRDKYPVTKLHTLIISKKHYPSVFELPAEELSSILTLAKVCRVKIINCNIQCVIIKY